MKGNHRFLSLGLGAAALLLGLALIVPGGGPSRAAGGIIYVDADASGANDGTSWEKAFTTLQPALETAVSGDQIWVAEGTYMPSYEVTPGDPRSASFQMKPGVAIYGGFDPDLGDVDWEDRDREANLTILSGDIGTTGEAYDNSYHVIFNEYTPALDDTAILDGFTIQNGNANGDPLWNKDKGGGMYNWTSPSLVNCVFTKNSASYGGGIYNQGRSILTGISFTGNSASYGGGMYIQNYSPIMTDATFTGNSAEYGGGIYNSYSGDATLNEVVFLNNSASYGGGMYNTHSSPSLVDVIFSTNSGSGMYNQDSSPVLTEVIFSDNQTSYSQRSGGGMANYNSYPVLIHAAFTGNSAEVSGGGMYNEASKPILANVSFSENQAAWGGGMYSLESNYRLVNVTFFGNSATMLGGGMVNDNSSPILTNLTLSGNSAAYADGGGGILNLESSPVMTNAILWGNTPNQISGDMVVTYSDVQDGYTGEGNLDADPLFEDAANGDIHLSAGSPCIDAGDNAVPYLPGYDFEGDVRVLDGNRDGTATVDMGVDEAGGELPSPKVIYVDEQASGEEDGTSWEDAFTLLQDALEHALNGDQIWVAAGTYLPTLPYYPGDPRTASFQMKNGVAIYGGFDPSVGDDTWEERDWVVNLTLLSGDLNGDDELDVANDVENSYHVFYHPAGTDLDGTAILDGFTIQDGNAGGDSPHDSGGGMYNYASSPALTHCIFSANAASRNGGGVYNYASAPVVSDSTFLNNESGMGYGGGMANDFSSPTLTNTSFVQNGAYAGGGGIYNRYASSPVLTNCTFYGNGTFVGAAGIGNAWSSPLLTNCILWDVLPEIEDYQSTTVITYSDILGGYAGEGNRNADPLFVDAANGDLHLSPDSPCMDAGSNTAASLPAYDFEGDDRILDSDGDGTATVDMGVDEYLLVSVETITTITGDDPDPSRYDEFFLVSCEVTSALGAPEGVVTVSVSDTPFYCSTSLVDGMASCWMLNIGIPGDYTLIATYEGEPGFAPSSDSEAHTVIPAVSVTTITSDEPDPSRAGEPFAVSFEVTSSLGALSGEVTVTVSGSPIFCTATLVDGLGSCQLILDVPGGYTLTAAYAGTPGFASSSDSELHSVRQEVFWTRLPLVMKN